MAAVCKLPYLNLLITAGLARHITGATCTMLGEKKKTIKIIIPILFYYIKAVRQFGCFTKICWRWGQPGHDGQT